MPDARRFQYTLERFVAEHVSYELVEDGDALGRALEGLRTLGPRSVAVDLEYTMHREHDRRRLRLVQVGVHGRQLLFDAQAVDARGLQELFGDERVEKQLHAPSGDYEQWLRYVRPDPEDVERWLFRNVFDTASRLNALNAAYRQLPRGRQEEVARLAGLEPPDEGRLLPLSIPDLSLHVLGFSFGRSHRHRWGQPKLSDAQLRYAALDVAVLPFVVEWVRALGDAVGVDLDAAAADEDRRNAELAADLALVPVTRRQELELAVKDAVRQAARREGTHPVSGLSAAERSYLLRRYGRKRGRSQLEERGGEVVAVTVPYRRQRELAALAARAASGEQVSLAVEDELERRFLADYVRRKHPELATG